LSPTTQVRRVFRGSEIVWNVTGSGDPIVFLRGFDVGFDTREFIIRLAANNTIIVPDHPGFGGSDVPAWLRGMADMAYFYLDFFEALELSNVHLVGASVGGWIAAEIAVRDRTRLGRLSLISPAGLRFQQQDFGDPFICAPDALNALLFAPDKIPAPETSVDEAAIDLRLKNSFALARIGWQPRLASAELHRWVHRIQTPLHLLWGGADLVIPPVHASAWREAIPHAGFTLLEGAGHLPHVEQPAAVAEAILKPAGGRAR
jgi:pimeloyl-ACP methyl ester carboxylesterase